MLDRRSDFLRIQRIVAKGMRQANVRPDRGLSLAGFDGTLKSRDEFFSTIAGYKRLGLHYPPPVPPTFDVVWAITDYAWRYQNGGGMPADLRASSTEIDAAMNADGWAMTSSGVNINLFDQRFAKNDDGTWVNRNSGQNLGTVVSKSSDQSHTIVGQITSGAGSIANDLVKDFGKAGQAAVQILKAGFSISKQIAQGNFTSASPFTRNSEAYHFVMDPSNNEAFEIAVMVLVALMLFANPALVPFLGRAAVSSLFMSPNPFAQVLRDAVVLATGQGGLNQGVDLAMQFVDLLFGVQVGPVTAIEVGVLILANFPLVPVGTIFQTILADPVAQGQIKRLGFTTLADKVIPVVTSCLKSNSADEWFRCFKDILETVIPGVKKLEYDLGVDIDKLRTVAAAIWRSGGKLMIAFDEERNAGVHDALLGLGVFGLLAIGEGLIRLKIIPPEFGTVRNPLDFVNAIAKVLPANLGRQLSVSVELVLLSAAAVAENKAIGLPGFAAAYINPWEAAQQNLPTMPSGAAALQTGRLALQKLDLRKGTFLRDLLDALNVSRFQFVPALVLLQARGSFDKFIQAKKDELTTTAGDAKAFVAAQVSPATQKLIRRIWELFGGNAMVRRALADLFIAAGLLHPAQDPRPPTVTAPLPAAPSNAAGGRARQHSAQPAPRAAPQGLGPVILGAGGGLLVGGPIGAAAGALFVALTRK